MCLAPPVLVWVHVTGMGLCGCRWGLGQVAGWCGLQVPIKGGPGLRPAGLSSKLPGTCLTAHLASPRVMSPARMSRLLAPLWASGGEVGPDPPWASWRWLSDSVELLSSQGAGSTKSGLLVNKVSCFCFSFWSTVVVRKMVIVPFHR